MTAIAIPDPVAPGANPVTAEPALPPAETAVVPAGSSANPSVTATIPLQQRVNYFPVLPPSRPCTPQDVPGLWRLGQVYENPAGSVFSDFTAYPTQYLFFSGDGTYNASKVQPAPDDNVALSYLSTQKPQSLQQFLVQESGFIFFYRDGAAIDTQACFIVANQRDPFRIGQMLLMPPQGQSATRVVKVYDRTGNSIATFDESSADKAQQKLFPLCESNCQSQLQQEFQQQDQQNIMQQCAEQCQQLRRDAQRQQRRQQNRKRQP